MQFCDHGSFGDFSCVSGEVPRETVLSLAHTVMVAWAEATVRKVDISSLYLSQWCEIQGNKSLIEFHVKLPAVNAHNEKIRFSEKGSAAQGATQSFF
ncbi:hypothetical protein CBR_g54886 [Chara braunii]|uniref:Uncharacterized protein n=1 Tax=Chara braunii TaxID=69332 RepID=A0A388JPS9_CHABU|nr:hypothetical protein CBR_g54886 [Chara braunii]|eukprot:GBG59783.1 hypothetical protein CBR_g54886 [Chara braunii]